MQMQRFGEKLLALRTRHGLTVRELASALGYAAHAHLTLVEGGKRKPSLDLVLRVAHYFNVSMDQLTRDDVELDE